MKLKMLAIAATLLTAASGGAMGQYVCPPGYGFSGGLCQPYPPQGYSNPVSGAVTGEAAGASSGYAVGGPIGAAVGGAIGTATGAVGGAANALVAQAVCAYGFMYYNGACYPVR